jgi:hypothetical protein
MEAQFVKVVGLGVVFPALSGRAINLKGTKTNEEIRKANPTACAGLCLVAGCLRR